jgi:hypothetical protein
MPTLTRRSPHHRDECWHVYYRDVHAGTIAKRTGVPQAMASIVKDYDPDGVAQTEIDHFGNCPVCGALIDMRDLGQLLAHIHDAEIEVIEGASPPRKGPVQ